jgi:ATP-dependent DNA helicase RecG
LADELGSGVRNLYKYGRRYSGQDPQLIDGDIFRIIVPLDDSYSFDAETKKAKKIHTNIGDGFGDGIGDGIGENIGKNETRQRIIEMMRQNPKVSAKTIAAEIGIALRNVKVHIKMLKQAGHIERVGSPKGGHWLVKRHLL